MATCPTCWTKYDDTKETCDDDGETLVPDAVFAHAEAAVAPGTMIGEYKVEYKIGEGAFGQVFRAVHPMIGKHAAIKVLGRALSYDPQMVSRFIAEARAVNQIRHKNIIDVFGFGALPDGRQWYAMELLEGMTFDAYLKRREYLSIAEAVPILRGIARALDAAHAKGIFHRDLKPENVFLVENEDGPPEPKLLDFGIAKLSKKGSSSHKTKTGAAMGTPYYMSPEQCRGHEIDARTDVYAFGVMAFEILTGSLPYQSENALELLLLHLNEPVPRASQRRPELGTAFDDVFARLMAKEKDQRPETASAALEQLAAAGGITVNRSGGARVVLDGPTRSGASAAAVNAATMPAPSSPSLDSSTTQAVSSPVAAGSSPSLATSASPSQTLGAQATDVRAPARITGRTYAAVAAVAVLVGAIGVVVVRPWVSSSRPPPLTSAAPIVSSAAQTTAAPTPSSAPKATVAITLSGVPDDAQVSLGENSLGKGPGPHVIPRGGATVVLSVVAKGMKPTTVNVDPSADATVLVRLEKGQGSSAGPVGPSTKPTGKPTGPISKDIAVPDFK